jgi:uncharacterized protein YjbJ (UPF0337 family)
MSSTTDKAKGYGNEAAGAIKEGVGKVVGSDQMQVDGAGQKIKGEAQVDMGKAKDAVKDGADQVDDAINRKL